MPVRLRDISADGQPVAPDTRASQALQRFLAEPNQVALPVVFERTPVGLLRRATLTDLALRAGTQALASLPVSRVMQSDPVIGEADLPVAHLAASLPSDPQRLFAEGCVVVDGGRYCGYAAPQAIAAALARENTARARALHQARDQLKAFKQAERRQARAQIGYLAALGHELRTPLSVMLGHADRLAGNPDLSASARESARLLVQTSTSLSRLVNDFVEAGEVGLAAVRIERTACPLRDLAEDLAALWLPAAIDRGLDLKLDLPRRLPERLHLDPVRLQQIVGNLLSNAIKYSDAGPIELGFDWADEGPESVLRVAIADRGPGLCADDVERLFQPFARMGETKQPGAGLGLYVSHTLARRMGGKLTHAARSGGGSVFTLHLPAQPARPRLAVQTPEDRRRGAFSLGTVLLVDDHPASLWLSNRALSEAGWQVDEATSLEQAQRRAAQAGYQAIICDLHLIDGEGETLARSIRTAPGPNQDGLLLALSADGREVRRARALDAGFDGMLVKPIRSGELVTRLADHIAAAQARTPDLRRRA